MDGYHRRADAVGAARGGPLRSRKPDRAGFGHACRVLHAGSFPLDESKRGRRPDTISAHVPTGIQQSQLDFCPGRGVGDLLRKRDPGFGLQAAGIFGCRARLSNFSVGAASDDLRYCTLWTRSAIGLSTRSSLSARVCFSFPCLLPALPAFHVALGRHRSGRGRIGCPGDPLCSFRDPSAQADCSETH